MDLHLQEKVAVVTGGAKGIGEAVVRLLAAEGAVPVIVDRDAMAGEALCSELTQAGSRVFFVQADLNSPEACRATVDSIVQDAGPVRVLINNAGYNDAVSLESSPDRFMESVQTNLLHVYAMTHFCLPHLRSARGSIVNVGSKVSVTGQGSTSGYAAAKGAVNALTREWAVALAADGVRVNAVLPAECLTHQYRRWFSEQSDPEQAHESIANLIPLGRRLTTPEEVAATIVFLASDRSSHTTGQILFVDGGYTHLDRGYGRSGPAWMGVKEGEPFKRS